jgi:hypothetical protein
MRPWNQIVRAGVLVCVLAALACGLRLGPGGESKASPDPAAFSSSTAWAHLEKLSEIGPREPGSVGSMRARKYLLDQLQALDGSEIREIRFEPADSSDAAEEGAAGSGLAERVHVISVLPGTSRDVVVLAAAYDSPEFEGFRHVGSNTSASGPAMVLELGRALSERPRPYTVWLVFLDADAVDPGGDPERHGFEGSRKLVETLDAEGSLERIRAVFFFDRVADSELVIARDLHSHGIYRDVFFEVAQERGLDGVFPRSGNFHQPRTGHRVFLDHGFRRVVAIVDPRHGPGAAPGVYWHSPDDTPEQSSQDSLEAVGTVSLEAISLIGKRLEKVDRFADPRLSEPGTGKGTPEPSRGSN